MSGGTGNVRSDVGSLRPADGGAPVTGPGGPPPDAPPEPAHDHEAARAARPNIAASGLLAGLIRRIGVEAGASEVDSVRRGPPLPPDEKRRLSKLVLDTVSGPDGGEAAKKACQRLVVAGALDGDLLRNLAAFAQRPRDGKLLAQGLDTPKLLGQLVERLDDQRLVNQGQRKGTCGACTMEVLLLRGDPAEFVKLVDGITGPGRQAQLRSGSVLALPENAIPADTSLRSAIDRLVQSSIMNRANLMGYIGFDYDNPSDESNFLSVLRGDSAIPLGRFADLYTDILGREMTPDSCFVFGEDDVLNKVEAALASGEQVPVLINPGAQRSVFHWVTCERIEHDATGRPRLVHLLDNGTPRAVDYEAFQTWLLGSVLPKGVRAEPDTRAMTAGARVELIRRLMDGQTDRQEERAIRNVLLSATPADLSAICDQISAEDLEDELEPEDLGAILAKQLAGYDVGRNSVHARALLHECGIPEVLAMLARLEDAHLKAVAAKPEGKALLQRALKRLEGSAMETAQEREGMKRIRGAIG